MSVRGATFLGIGSMVGAGIFALLGEAGTVAGSAVWLSFLLAGIVAGLLGYTVVKLGVRYPSSGGLIAYLMAGFGNGRMVGIAAWLGYISAIVIVGAMVAVSFGSYATSLFIGSHAGPAWDNVFTSLVVLLTLGINMVGSKIVDRAQTAIVLVELAVFAVFVVVTIGDADWGLLAFSGYPSVSDIVASVALTFFAFLGFSVISFSVGDLKDPGHDLPRAMSGAIGLTAALYVLIALGVFGTLSVGQVVDYGETAIAEAARPSLGDAGFAMMAVAAVLATASSLNATLYASGGLTRSLAEAGQFPAFFGRRTARGNVHVGLLLTAFAIFVVANLVDLSAIASVGSAIALIVFVLVGLAGWRRRAETGASAVLTLAAIASAAVVLAFFAVDTWENDPATFGAIIAIALLAVLLNHVSVRPPSTGAHRSPRPDPAAGSPS
jgi:amino acid transporter